MSFNQAAVIALFQALESQAMTLGVFATVNDHEPESPPGNGLSYSFQLNSIEPVKSSGLAATSGRVEFTGIVWLPRRTQPPGGPAGLDQSVLTAATTLLAAYSGDLDLGGTVRCIDLLGAYGAPLAADAVNIEWSGTTYRAMQVTLPVVINDIWGQSA